jgi:hypothetical protein
LRLRLNEKIAGWPAKEVRAVLRHFSRDLWTVKEAASLLEAPEGRTRRLVYTLRKLGYVEVASGQLPGTWRNTMTGNALAHATAALPISRVHADRQLKEFLARVETVNGDESWPHRVGKVVLFGSYLSNQESLGDIDLAIRLERRAVFADHWHEAVLARADAAARQGRRFRGFLDRLAWAEKEVKKFLRGGKHVLSLHDWTTEEPWLQDAPTASLLDEGTDATSTNGSSPENGNLLVKSEKRRRPRGPPF